MKITVPKNEIPPGQGKYFPGELGKTKGVAVFRRSDGSFAVFSADCPHRHCEVEWRAAKKDWSCPCHGSAFSSEGKLKNGPAMTDLQTIPFRDEGDSLTVEPL